jgi:hypothetical protein
MNEEAHTKEYVVGESDRWEGKRSYKTRVRGFINLLCSFKSNQGLNALEGGILPYQDEAAAQRERGLDESRLLAEQLKGSGRRSSDAG